MSVIIAGVRSDPLPLIPARMLRRVVLCGLAAFVGAEPRPGGLPTAFALRPQRLALGMRLRGERAQRRASAFAWVKMPSHADGRRGRGLMHACVGRQVGRAD